MHHFVSIYDLLIVTFLKISSNVLGIIMLIYVMIKQKISFKSINHANFAVLSAHIYIYLH